MWGPGIESFEQKNLMPLSLYTKLNLTRTLISLAIVYESSLEIKNPAVGGSWVETTIPDSNLAVKKP